MKEYFVALKERIHELRAKALGHSYEINKHVQRIKFHAHEEDRLEQEISKLKIRFERERVAKADPDLEWSIRK